MPASQGHLPPMCRLPGRPIGETRSTHAQLRPKETAVHGLPIHDGAYERPEPTQHCELIERPGGPWGNSTPLVEVVKN